MVSRNKKTSIELEVESITYVLPRPKVCQICNSDKNLFNIIGLTICKKCFEEAD
jgi:hypothetical protein